jgi:ParB family chromosome partitioning protein
MARKNLLKGLLAETATDDKETATASLQRPHYKKGAIGAVGQSIADLKSRSINDVDTDLIDAGGMQDRLEQDDAAHRALVESIRVYGQQVPVLLRPHPHEEGRFEVVYGRRRVLATRDLGQKVKAMVRDLDDREAVVAQGQENTARRDLSFIEKANFARQMRSAGYERRIICDALHIDKTIISRMFSIIDRVPVVVIEAIGTAPSIGRDRWLELADMIETTGKAAEALPSFFEQERPSTSDKRFEAFYAWMKRSKAAASVAQRPEALELFASDGRAIGRAKRGRSKVVLTFESKAAGGFDDWLVSNLGEIHRTWLNKDGE